MVRTEFKELKSKQLINCDYFLALYLSSNLKFKSERTKVETPTISLTYSTHAKVNDYLFFDY